MQHEPDRRALLTSMVAAAAAPLLPSQALAADRGVGNPYRTATELVTALADKKISSLAELIEREYGGFTPPPNLT